MGDIMMGSPSPAIGPVLSCVILNYLHWAGFVPVLRSRSARCASVERIETSPAAQSPLDVGSVVLSFSLRLLGLRHPRARLRRRSTAAGLRSSLRLGMICSFCGRSATHTLLPISLFLAGFCVWPLCGTDASCSADTLLPIYLQTAGHGRDDGFRVPGRAGAARHKSAVGTIASADEARRPRF